jgi:hypothetical protein
VYEIRRDFRIISSITSVPTPSATYTGPGDIVSGAYAWWGLRAYSAATIGDDCIELRRDSDNALQTFVTLSDGSLDVASISTFKGAANLFVRTLHDQTGNGRHHIQATNGDQPEFFLAGLGSLPVIGSPGGDNFMATSGTHTIAQPFTVSAVAFFDTIAGLYCFYGSGSGNTKAGRRGNAAIIDAGTEGTAPAHSAGWHAVQDIFDNASSDIVFDGVSNTVTSGAISPSASTLYFMVNAPSESVWLERIVEQGIWASAFAAGKKTEMDTNQQAYWGI